MQHTIVLHVTTCKNHAKVAFYLVRLPPLLERVLEPPVVRILPPAGYPPALRIVPEEDERTVDVDDERVEVLVEREVVLDERVTPVELLRTGVAVLVRVVVVRVAVLRFGAVAVLRVVVVVLRLGVAVVRVVLVVERVPVAVVRVAVVLRLGVATLPFVREPLAVVLTVALPKVRSLRVALTRVAVPRVVVPAARTAVRVSVRRAVSNARAFCTLRDALRVANERSGWR